MATINMQTMRYINILDRTTRVKTRKCFIYNGTIFFAVPRAMMSRAIGPSALNVRKIQEKLGKKVKIIKEPETIKHREIERFISDVVNPTRFKNIEIRSPELVITAGNNQSKASLIGRNKRRYEELDKVIKDTFGLELKII